MHLKGLAEVAAREDGDRLAHDIYGCRRLLDDVHRSHDCSPKMTPHPLIIGWVHRAGGAAQVRPSGRFQRRLNFSPGKSLC
jgi:hypothetical protein